MEELLNNFKMDWFTSIIISIGLAMDAFAVSLGIGTSEQPKTSRSILRLSFHFGFFQGGMTFLGWLAGQTIANFIASFDHWVALLLLSFVGIRMIYSGLSKEKESYKNDPTRGGTLVILSVATSIDAMAVGLGLAMLEVRILLPCITIGVITFFLSLVGLLWGVYLGNRFGKRMEIVGGFILIAIGLRILFTHLT